MKNLSNIRIKFDEGGRVLKNLKRIIKEADKVYEQVMTEYFGKANNSVEFGYTDAVALGLSENLINHSKSIIILLENNHHASLDTILRTIFENYVFLKFILEDNSTIRAKSYIYSTKIKEIQLMNNLTEDSLGGYNLREFLGVKKNEITDKFTKGMSESYKEETIRGYIDELGMKRLEQKWYNLDGGTKNLKILCEKMELSVEYNLIYSILSTETHAKDAIRNFLFEENRIDLLNVMKDEKLYVSMGGLYLMKAARLIYMHYGLKKQLKNFNTLLALNYKI